MIDEMQITDSSGDLRVGMVHRQQVGLTFINGFEGIFVFG